MSVGTEFGWCLVLMSLVFWVRMILLKTFGLSISKISD